MRATASQRREVDIESPPDQIDAITFRAVLGRFATGVTVITTRAGGRAIGVTPNSFNTVSLDPPLVLWSLSLSAPSLPAFRAADRFAVSILAEDQRDLAARFTAPSPEKFLDVPVRRGLEGLPLIEGAIVHVECRVVDRYPGGDHEIMLGAIDRLAHFEGEPLVFHRGRFSGLSGRDGPETPRPSV
jgi:flavin reductase (DIM6/NTAB) family NADH-FMN oxidoreductase RutF